MQVTRIKSAERYEAPEHYDMACLRLQGREASATEAMWVGLSHLLPGGHTAPKASAQEKIYVVVAGEVTFKSDSAEAVLGPLDSVTFARHEQRVLENRTTQPATVLLIMEEDKTVEHET